MAKESIVKSATATVAPVTVSAPQSKSPPVTLSDAQKEVFDKMTTKSARIRYLHGLGFQKGPIAKYLSVVYGKTVLFQHVRNVLVQPLKTQATHNAS
jgi:hypothetical protein